MADVNVMQPSNLATIETINPKVLKQDALGTKLTESSTDKNSFQQESMVRKVQKLQDVKLSNEQLDGLIERVNKDLSGYDSYLKFEKNEDVEEMVVFIKNRETDEVLRQIPSQEFLTVSKNIKNFLEMRQQLSEKIAPVLGLIADEKV
ncbi:flagellar protein FlaG [Hydrogenovibrio sp. 3SP14C1]|uniref:flagellar protein FlaG n=1 Tax=Hydrogenovibrio sp. 3SP14C1 TaxID=3038774 RepID=UPI002417139C|nr:flagellar protein FlaG [Hydrogenovibrio sp. 3SP14C1]MDG4812949.1 flagellar protein FlaG [Hydrogenovibrio sp. 3SP14C1]